MIILSIYAMVVWSLAAAFRRTWKGYAFVAAGAAFVLPLVDPLVYLVWWWLGEKPTWVFPFLYAYAALLAVMGTFLASLPKKHAGRRCVRCGYDLAGNVTGACPECGREIDRPRRVSPRALHRSVTETR